MINLKSLITCNRKTFTKNEIYFLDSLDTRLIFMNASDKKKLLDIIGSFEEKKKSKVNICFFKNFYIVDCFKSILLPKKSKKSNKKTEEVRDINNFFKEISDEIFLEADSILLIYENI